MNAIRRSIFPLALAWLGLGHISFLLAATAGTTFSAIKTELSVDGTACGAVQVWQGGEAVGEVVIESAVAGAAPKKHIGNFHYAPVSVTLRYPLAAPLITLINDFLGNRATPRTVALSDLDLNGKVLASSVEVASATLAEVNFADLDGASKARAEVTLVFEGTVRASPAVGTTPARSTGITKTVLASNFSFRLDGALPTAVGAISAFSVKRRPSADEIGTSRGVAAPGPLVLSNLVVTVREAQSATWKTWADDFLINGNRADSQERNATLDLLGPSLTTTECSFQFSHVGIVRLSRVPAPPSETVRKLEAELYYETLALGAAASTGSTPAVTPPPAPTSPAAPAKEPVTPVVTDPASPAAAVDPADAGGHDPADFPRIGSIVRKSYSSDYRESSATETIAYTSKLAPKEIAAAYVSALNQAGWEESKRSETGDAAGGTQNLRLMWSKKLQSSDINIYQTKTGGSEISIGLWSNRAGALGRFNAAMKEMNADLASAGGSPNDLGARDPADFPRITGSVRKSFSASGTPKAPQETAVYRAKVPLAKAEGFFVNRLPQAEWEQSQRREEGDPAAGSHILTHYWSVGRRTAVLNLTEISAELTEINVTLSTSALP